MATWARIEARSYEDALELIETLSSHPSALIQEGEHSWSVYVSASAGEVPTIVHGIGVDPHRVSLVDRTGEPPADVDDLVEDFREESTG